MNTARSKHGFVCVSCTVTVLVFALPVGTVHAIEPAPPSQYASWAGQTWGELLVTPAITRAGNSVTARAIVRGSPGGNYSWHCSQYSGWVAAGTDTIAIVIPEDWSFGSGPGFVRNIGGRSSIKTSSAGDPPPYGWEDRLSDTCYCDVGTWGASGGCETGEIVPTFGRTHQDEIIIPGPTGKWVRVTAEFYGWNGVAHVDQAVAYVMVIAADTELEDNDNDGIYDGWEIAFFGDLTTASASSNYDDGDGISDLQEYQMWENNTLDDDGQQYDPTVNNKQSKSTGGDDGGTSGGAAPCGSAGPVTMMMGLLSLSLLGSVQRRRRCRE